MIPVRFPRRGRWLRWFVVVTALIWYVGSPPAAAEPRDLSFQVSFGQLVPGEPTTRVDTFELDRDATLSALAWVRRDGVLGTAELAVRLCDSSGSCVDATPAGDRAVLRAGTITATVSAELPASGPAGGGEGHAIGRLTMRGADGGPDGGGVGVLPGTGSDTGLLLLWGGAALFAGTALLAWAARARQGSVER